ncbi:hypothetical protein [Burkholderia pyrrocinia]|uniref:hypothetical protein n=1 Tax=Burkholderia pyrrocinia TaxID=60550 RepID=UPI00191BF41B|nr:hypothetical protein [Burkholderia pyrrocinia]
MSFRIEMRYSYHPSMRDHLPRAITDSATCLTHPIVCDDLSLSFSAYGPGWGYVAIKLPADVIRERLGASTATPEQLLIAFECNREKITVAVNRHALPNDGRHVRLDKSDFQI